MGKQRLRFSLSDDIILIQEALKENPFENSIKWSIIRERVNKETSKNFTNRCLKEHLQHIITYSLTKEGNILHRKRLGTKEHDRFKLLLQDVVDIAKKYNFEKKKKFTKVNIDPANTPKQENTALLDIVGNSSHSINPEFQHIGNILEVQMDVSEQKIIDSPVDRFEETVTSDNESSCSHLSSQTSNVLNETPGVPSQCPPQFQYNKKRRPSLINFIRRKQQLETALFKEELELKSKKLKLEESVAAIERDKLKLAEEKFKFEKIKYEREAKEKDIRFQMEMEERKERLEADREQRQMLLTIFKTVIEKS